MQIQQRVLRVAAAAGVTLFLVGGALGPAYATSGTSGDTASTHQSQKVKAGKAGADHSHGNASTTGDSSEPQPESTADQNDGGANAGECDQSTDSTATSGSTDSTQGDSTQADSTQSDDAQPADSTETSDASSYCSTRDGSPSMNGNGGGKATGKPCAGCVGKADNKNPKGQYPDGSDANNGYECDGNHGIGRSNPAHTGCTSESTTPGGKPTKSEDCDDPAGCEPPCPPGSTACPVPGTPEQVLGGTQAAGTAGTANRPAADVAPASAGLLPETGAGRFGIPIAAGLALLGAGGALLLRKRSHAGS